MWGASHLWIEEVIPIQFTLILMRHTFAWIMTAPLTITAAIRSAAAENMNSGSDMPPSPPASYNKSDPRRGLVWLSSSPAAKVLACWLGLGHANQSIGLILM